eukprot:5974505-Lingulodinium_polyedra.AAC.1
MMPRSACEAALGSKPGSWGTAYSSESCTQHLQTFHTQSWSTSTFRMCPAEAAPLKLSFTRH